MNSRKEMRHGPVCDLVKFLSSKERDYLVRNNGDKVRVDSLRGNIVVLYIIHLSRKFYTKRHMLNIKVMVDAYNQLSVRGDFEIVFVATQKNKTCEAKHKEFFNKFFSKMPWLAIPYFDLETRARFIKFWHLHNLCIIDKQGVLRNKWNVEHIQYFGAGLYPFTSDRIKEIEKDDEEALNEMTLRSLLSSPSRDYVVSNSKEKVPISRLEGKVVGLYLYDKNEPVAQRLTPKLVKVYKELKGTGEDFEIVMINLNFLSDYEFNEESFDKEFKSMPWLALPFKDLTCTKLLRMFKPYINPDNKMDNVFIIVGPGGNIFERLGANVVWSYGISAYPFTLGTVAERKILGLKALNIESVLIGLDVKSIYAKGGEEFHISYLNGKNILLFVGRNDCNLSHKLMQVLLHRDHGCQVVYVSLDKNLSSFNSFFNQMPWLALPFNVEKTIKLSKILKFDHAFPCLLAFGPDGGHLTNYGRLFLKNCVMNNECQLFNYSFGQLFDYTKSDMGLELFTHCGYEFDSDSYSDYDDFSSSFSDCDDNPGSDASSIREMGSDDDDRFNVSPLREMCSDDDDKESDMDWDYDCENIDIPYCNGGYEVDFDKHEDLHIE